MPSPFLPSGKPRPTGEIREIQKEKLGLWPSEIFDEVRRRRPDFIDISDKKLRDLIKYVAHETSYRSNSPSAKQYLPSGLPRPKVEICQILTEHTNLSAPEAVAKLRERRPELAHISNQKLLYQTHDVMHKRNYQHVDARKVLSANILRHRIAAYIKTRIEAGHQPSKKEIIDDPQFFKPGLNNREHKNASIIVRNAFKSVASLIEIAAELHMGDLQRRSTEDLLQLESEIEKSTGKYVLLRPSAEILAIQKFIDDLVKDGIKKRHSIVYVIRNALSSFALAKNPERSTYYRQCEKQFRNVMLYLSARSGYRLSYQEELRAIMQSLKLKGTCLTRSEISRLTDNIYGEQPEAKTQRNRAFSIDFVASEINYAPRAESRKKPDSVLGKMKNFILASDKIFTRRQIVGALNKRSWYFESLNKAEREILYIRAYRAAAEVKRQIALSTVTEVIAQLLTDAYLVGQGITSALLHKELRVRRLKRQINQEDDIEPEAIDKIREPLELSLFTECATGPLKTIAKALQKFPADYTDEEARLMRAMMQAVLQAVPDYHPDQFEEENLQQTKQKLQRVGYQKYKIEPIRNALMIEAYQPAVLLASLRLVRLATRCVFTHAKNNENGILSWYKTQPPLELMAKTAHRAERNLARGAPRSRPEAA